MARDVKEVIGVLMRVLNGEEITQADVEDLGFEGDGELQSALNAAYIKLLEFVHDRDARQRDRALDRRMRASLQSCLDQITIACDREEQSSSLR